MASYWEHSRVHRQFLDFLYCALSHKLDVNLLNSSNPLGGLKWIWNMWVIHKLRMCFLLTYKDKINVILFNNVATFFGFV